MKKNRLLHFLSTIVVIALAALSFSACSETNDEDEEFSDWKNTNERTFTTLYNNALQQQGSGNGSWKVIKSYAKSGKTELLPEDHIVVRVISDGTDSESPLYTDTVSIHYRGRLLASKSYPDGYIFDSSWDGEYNLSTMRPDASKPVKGYSEGFATALQHMKKGDRWEVYIPYQLAYGVSGLSEVNIPGCSMLIFDLTLDGYHR